MGTIISSSPITKIKSYAQTSGFSAITGVTTNEITGSILIDPNTVGAGTIEITARAIKTGTSGTLTVRIYANTTNSLSGAILLGSSPAAAASSLYVQLSRTAFIDKTLGTKLLQAGGQAYNDDTAFNGAPTNATIDWGQGQYIILAVQNGSATDSTEGAGLIFKIYN